MGGRAAEIVLFNKIQINNEKTNYTNAKVFENIDDLDITTGASGDLKQADYLARKYIELFGYTSDDFRSKIPQSPNSPYLSLSEDIKSEIDENVLELINLALTKAIKIIEENLDSFNKLATDLIQKKSVDLKYLNELPVNYL